MPIFKKPEIKEKVKSGEIAILSLDTNVFSRSQNNLESGIISYLTQFADSEIDLALSDIVVAELKSHIKSTAISARKYLKQSIKEIQKAKFNNEKLYRDSILDIIDSEEPDNLAERRISNFLKSTKAKIVTSDKFLPVNNLIVSYFESIPPFEKGEKKKYEFLDAVALYSLESYAQEIQKMILVVSNDKGWKKYCSESEWLICEDNLGIAMGYFQGVQGVAEVAILKHKEDFRESINAKLSEYVRSMYVYAYVESSKYNVTCESSYIHYYEFNYDWTPAFTLIEHNEEEEKYVFNLYISVEVSVSATLGFYLTGDNKDFYAGSAEVDEHFSQSGDVTIVVLGNLNGSLSIESIYVDSVDEDFHFGDITPES